MYYLTSWDNKLLCTLENGRVEIDMPSFLVYKSTAVRYLFDDGMMLTDDLSLKISYGESDA